MDWHLIPWAAVSTVSIAAIGWLGRLHYVSNRNSERLKDLEKDVHKHGEEIGLTNSRITIVEKSIIELGAKAITRQDLKEVKTELVDRMDQLGNRMEKTVDRIVDVVTAKGSSTGGQAMSAAELRRGKDWTFAVYADPDPVTVAQIVKSHGFTAAAERWSWIGGRTLSKLAAEGQRRMQAAA